MPMPKFPVPVPMPAELKKPFRRPSEQADVSAARVQSADPIWPVPVSPMPILLLPVLAKPYYLLPVLATLML